MEQSNNTSPQRTRIGEPTLHYAPLTVRGSTVDDTTHNHNFGFENSVYTYRVN